MKNKMKRSLIKIRRRSRRRMRTSHNRIIHVAQSNTKKTILRNFIKGYHQKTNRTAPKAQKYDISEQKGR